MTEPFTQLLIAFVLAFGTAGAFYGFIAFYTDKHFDDTKHRDDIALWLIGEEQTLKPWAAYFCKFFDTLFGKNHLSLQCFARSAYASIFFILLLYGIAWSSGVFGREARTLGEFALSEAFILALFISVIPDYLSLLETRWLLGNLKRIHSFWAQIAVLTLDLLLTGGIAYGAISLYCFLIGLPLPSLMHLIGVYDAFSLFFYSAFLTSLWAWLYCVSTWIRQLFVRMRLYKILPVEKTPLQQINLVASVLLFLLIMALSLLLSVRTAEGVRWVDDRMCAINPELCQNVAMHAKDARSKMHYILKSCTGGDTTLCYANAVQKYDIKPADMLPDAQNLCNANDGLSCAVVSLTYLSNDKLKEASKNAFHYAEKACALNDMYGCNILGFFYSRENENVSVDYKRAVALYKNSCDKGIIGACGNLGNMYQNGNGVEENYTEAHRLYELACNGSDMNGCNNLGTLLRYGTGVSQNQAEAERLYKLACTNGETKGCFNLAAFYHYDRNEPEKARPIYEESCEKDDAISCANLASLLLKDKPSEPVKRRAVGLYRKACKQRYSTACANLASFYYTGNYVAKDFTKALKLFLKACENDARSGCGMIGTMYANGEGTQQDFQLAKSYYTKACDNDDITGCAGLGFLYHEGKGVPQDYGKAYKLHHFACEHGESIACVNLGGLYYMGSGVKQNYPEAKKLYEKACLNNYMLGCTHLAVMYGQGTGVEKDEQLATKLLNFACEHAEQKACEGLKELSKGNPL